MLWILWCRTKTTEVLLGISVAAGSWLHFSLAITCDHSEPLYLKRSTVSAWLMWVQGRTSWVQFGKYQENQPSSRAPQRMGWGLSIFCFWKWGKYQGPSPIEVVLTCWACQDNRGNVCTKRSNKIKKIPSGGSCGLCKPGKGLLGPMSLLRSHFHMVLARVVGEASEWGEGYVTQQEALDVRKYLHFIPR